MDSRNWYYVEIISEDGDTNHEIHKEYCVLMPEKDNRLYLGNFTNCEDALREAEKLYQDHVTACSRCCN